MPDVTIVRLDQRPDLIDHLYELDDGWPEFMSQDPIANALMNRVAREFPHTCVAAIGAGGTVVARGRSMPVALGGEGRETLPDGGLDRALVWAFGDLARGTQPTAACAIEIAIDAAYKGQGLSYRMLAAMSDAVRDAGLTALVAPVRPNQKDLQPATPMADYIALVRDDGLPVDAWLRVHVRAGGRIIGVAPASMTMAGSLAEWRDWTGLPFDRTGDVIVPGALVPVVCDVTHDYAAYVEPNVWVRHDLR
ncbi:MAG TPA: N-acetyltransferase [Micromonosporaceae bacterium]